jgi:hypothetical protein
MFNNTLKGSSEQLGFSEFIFIAKDSGKSTFIAPNLACS